MFTEHLDFATLEQATGEYITDDLRERHNDSIWRVRWKDAWCYIFLMIEFQSSQHGWMALRMLTYTALLWENLVKTGNWKTGDKLPPVFPIVLYNGDNSWQAATDISDLVMPIAPELDAYQPRYKYYIIDEKRINASILARARGGAGYVIKVEQAETKEQLYRLAIDFDSRGRFTKTEAAHLAMLEWMERKITYLPSAPSANRDLSADREETLLAELIEKYKRPYIDAGFAEGRKQGINEGISKGIEQGITLGEARGILSIIKEMLIEKFGEISPRWETALGGLTDSGRLVELYRSLSRAGTPDEVEKILTGIA